MHMYELDHHAAPPPPIVVARSQQRDLSWQTLLSGLTSSSPPISLTHAAEEVFSTDGFHGNLFVWC